MTPLHAAVSKGHSDIAEELLKNGANPNLTSFDQTTPLQYAIVKGDLKLVNLLVEHKADLSRIGKKGMNPLGTAIAANHPELARHLLQLGASPDTPDANGLTALHHAVERGQNSTLESLVQFKAKVDTPLPSGYTPLMVAVQKGNLDAAKTLIQAGASLNRIDPEGRTLRDLARDAKHPELESFLKKAIRKNADTNPPLKQLEVQVETAYQSWQAAFSSYHESTDELKVISQTQRLIKTMKKDRKNGTLHSSSHYSQQFGIPIDTTRSLKNGIIRARASGGMDPVEEVLNDLEKDKTRIRAKSLEASKTMGAQKRKYFESLIRLNGINGKISKRDREELKADYGFYQRIASEVGE
jgi:ankyrin repeat protein